MKDQCAYCGANPAAGYAAIEKGGEMKRYCHEDGDPTCYERAQVNLARANLKQVEEFLGRRITIE